MERSPSKVTLLLLVVAAALLSVAFAPTPAFAAGFQNELHSSNDGASDDNNNNKINRGPIIKMSVPLESMILEEKSTTDEVLPSSKSNEYNNDNVSPTVSLRSFILEVDRKVGGDGKCLASCTGAGQCAWGCYCTGIDTARGFKVCLGLCCI